MEGFSTEILIFLAFVGLFAAMTHAAIGFGIGLFIVPALLWAMGTDQAITVSLAASLIVAGPLGWRYLPYVHKHLLLRLSLASLAGIPIGMWLQGQIDVRGLQFAIAIAIFVSLLADVGLQNHKRKNFPKDGRALKALHASEILTGVAAGALTVLLATPGPPVVLYALLRGIAAREFRATTFTFFAVITLVAFIYHSLQFGFSGLAVDAFAILFVPIVLGMWIGNKLADHLEGTAFVWAVRVLLLIMAAASLFAAEAR